MKQLRFTTTLPHSIFSVDDAKALVIPDNLDEIIMTSVKGTRAYIHDDAEDLAGFDLPGFLDGDMGQLDLPLNQQDILMLLPQGNYKCIAELQGKDSIDAGAYYITLHTDAALDIAINELSLEDQEPEYDSAGFDKYGNASDERIAAESASSKEDWDANHWDGDSSQNE